MSQRLVSLNDDLQRLQDEGYNIEVRSTGYLVIRDVPYVNSHREVMRGTLVSELSLVNDRTVAPATHVIFFAGEYPCNLDSTEIGQIRNQSGRQVIDRDLPVDHSFSNKPTGGYVDHYHKVTTYAGIVSGPARAIDGAASARTYPLIRADAEESVFEYVDTASSRAGIAAASRKLELARIAIVGVGGTGSYVLDFVAKTPVKEIHLFDADRFSQHNAFRSPGAASCDDLEKRVTKGAYLQAQYSRMRRGVIAHEQYIDRANVEVLRNMAFVFLCLDRGEDKQLIITKLEEFGVGFVDVGMGLYRDCDSLGGILRVTTSTVGCRQHVKQRVSFATVGDDEYRRNVQVADLNALNAALAVIRWKKVAGFYYDFEGEHNSTYTVETNLLTSGDQW